MSQYTDANCKAHTADAAVTKHARVKLDSDGKVTEATATSSWEGTATRAASASGDVIDIRLRTASGTHKMIASEAITVGNPVYAAADGEIAADGSVLVGYAEESAGADGDIIEVQVASGSGAGGYLAVAQQALSGAGAITVDEYYTAWTTTGADAGTMADGTFAGQLKKVQLIVDGGNGTLTPTSFTNGTTVTFADAGDYALFVWDGDSWTAIELGNDADGATAPAVA